MPSRKTPYTNIHYLTFGLALLLSILVAFLGVQTFRSGLSQYQLRAFLDDWQSQRQAPSDAAWQVALDAGHKAIELYPLTANGEYLENLGRAYEWRYFDQPFGDRTAEDSRREALNQFRQAIEARPQWPDSYVRLAFVKLKLLEFDNEFAGAYQNAFEMGPWREWIQPQLAEIALIAWPSLNSDLKELARETFRRTLQINLPEAVRLYKLAVQAKMTEEYCGSLNLEGIKIKNFCPVESS